MMKPDAAGALLAIAAVVLGLLALLDFVPPGEDTCSQPHAPVLPCVGWVARPTSAAP